MNFTSENQIIKYFPELENRDLLFISYEKEIPPNYNGVTCNFKIDANGVMQVETITNKKRDPKYNLDIFTK